jgi:predicted RNA binding protein YcfA (HicA-like mRNA interferase family)
MTEGRLPVLRPQEVIHALEKLGFVCTRQSKGSHRRFAHSDGRKTTVPVHKGRTIGRGLLRKILRDVGVSVEELLEAL